MGAQELHGQTGRGRQAEATQQQRMRQLSRRRQNRIGLHAHEPPGLEDHVDDDDDDDDVGRQKLHNSSGCGS